MKMNTKVLTVLIILLSPHRNTVINAIEGITVKKISCMSHCVYLNINDKSHSVRIKKGIPWCLDPFFYIALKLCVDHVKRDNRWYDDDDKTIHYGLALTVHVIKANKYLMMCAIVLGPRCEWGWEKRVFKMHDMRVSDDDPWAECLHSYCSLQFTINATSVRSQARDKSTMKGK